MSKYAKINSKNIVENIILCDDSQIQTQAGTHIKVTNETNEPFQGFEYNLEKNKFTSPQPYESWTLNADTLIWECPDGPKPDGFYKWNEETLKWETLS